MRVNIGSFGQFHTFDLAKQAESQGALGSVYTAYPWWKVRNLPAEKTHTFPYWMLAAAAAARMDSPATIQHWLNWRTLDSFDHWVAHRLSSCDVYHCLSSSGLLAHRVARQRYGALTVCDRASSHIRYQDRLLAEEHCRWNLPYRHIDSRVVARELEEYEECDVITVPSSFAYNSFVAEGCSVEKLKKVPYGVEMRLFRPVPKEDKMFRVIYVGTVSVRKGVLYLLQAMEPLFGKIEVWIIGAVEPIIKPRLAEYEGRVRFLGRIPRSELYRYYSQGSIFVLPSIEEGLAVVQPQAMACGLPVIASTNTGADDLFTDSVEGYIVPIRDPKAIRERILHLYDNPELRNEMGRLALRRVQLLGDWSSYCEKLLAVYREAIRRQHYSSDGVVQPAAG
jgi:alpha-maltose-1-phosphate synthase